MPRKGQMGDMDNHEQSIRDNASEYVVTGFKPGSSVRSYMRFADLRFAIEYGKQLLKDEIRLRSIMVYALDDHEHHALVGTIRRDGAWQEVVPKVY